MENNYENGDLSSEQLNHLWVQFLSRKLVKDCKKKRFLHLKVINKGVLLRCAMTTNANNMRSQMQPWYCHVIS